MDIPFEAAPPRVSASELVELMDRKVGYTITRSFKEPFGWLTEIQFDDGGYAHALDGVTGMVGLCIKMFEEKGEP